MSGGIKGHFVAPLMQLFTVHQVIYQLWWCVDGVDVDIRKHILAHKGGSATLKLVSNVKSRTRQIPNSLTIRIILRYISLMNALLLKVYLANCERVIVSEDYFLSLPGYEWSPSQRISQITILLVCCWVTALAGTLQVKPNLCNSSTCWSLSFCTEFYRLLYKSPICILGITNFICPNSPGNWSVSQAVKFFIVMLSLIVIVCQSLCSKHGFFVTFIFCKQKEDFPFRKSSSLLHLRHALVNP